MNTGLVLCAALICGQLAGFEPVAAAEASLGTCAAPETPRVLLDTYEGKIEIELVREAARQAVERICELVVEPIFRLIDLAGLDFDGELFLDGADFFDAALHETFRNLRVRDLGKR